MPQAIPSLVFAFLSSNAITFSLAGSALAINAISAAVTAGLYAGVSLAMAGRSRSPRPDQAKQTLHIADSPVAVLLGRGRGGGSMLFGNAQANYLHRHTAIFLGPIDGIEEYYINKRAVVVDEDGMVSSPPYYRSDGPYAHLFSRLGENTETAFEELLAAFPDLYSEDHRGDNLAQLHARYLAPTNAEFLKVFPNGKPNTEILGRGLRDVYDPRIDNYQWSDNGPLNVLKFLLLPARYGWGMPAGLFDMEDIAETADRADDPIALKEGGTAPASRCGGVYWTDRPRGETLAELLLSTGTRIVRLTNGKFSIRLEEDDPDIEHAVDRSCVQEFEWATGQESFERPNRMDVTFFPAQQDYSATQLDTEGLRWGRDPDEVDRVGERIDTITLNFCQWHGQASRIARRLWYKRRAQRGQVTENLHGMGVFGRTYASVPFIGLDRAFRATMVQPQLRPDGVTVTIPFVAFPELPDYDPEEDQADEPDQLPDSSYSGNVPKPAAPSEATQVVYPDTARELRVAVAVPASHTAEINVRRYTGGNPDPWQNMAVHLGETDFGWIAGDHEGVVVDARLRVFNAEGESSPLSDYLHIADPGVQIDNSAPDAPEIERENEGVGAPFEDFRTIAGSALNVAYLEIQHADSSGGPWTAAHTVKARPHQVSDWLSVAMPGGFDWTRYVRAVAFSSNGTASPASNVIAVAGETSG